MAGRSLRDRYVTLYGRKPVLEALEAPDVDVAKVFLVAGSGGAAVEAIVAAAAKRGVEVERVRVEFVTSLTRNGRQHQGVAADVTAPELSGLDTFLERRRGRHHATSVLVLDGVTNPANLGLALRSAAAAGLHGVVVPRRNTAELGPLAVKASAGVALRAPIVRCDTAAEAVAALAEARFHVVGLDARPGATSLFEAALPER
ncbi:MAG: RNA methyltransferase, partial [Acidimicrobiia bacterium]|nr:RNA methyltransferase [Acidimicrobiia bacterium]